LGTRRKSCLRKRNTRRTRKRHSKEVEQDCLPDEKPGQKKTGAQIKKAVKNLEKGCSAGQNAKRGAVGIAGAKKGVLEI